MQRKKSDSGSPNAPSNDFMTIQELAEEMRISKALAWSLVLECREIPYYRFSSRAVRLTRSDVDAYVARCRSDVA